MVALCVEHHAQADVGTFSREELRGFKVDRAGDDPSVAGRFNWMRDDLIAFVGGVFFVDVAVAVQIGRHPVVWFNRDDEGRVLVNLFFPSLSGKPRLRMEDNVWIETGEPEDFECPPSGARIFARYGNGDRLSVRFREISSKEEFVARYPQDELLNEALARAGSPNTLMDIALGIAVRFPVAVAEIELRIADTPPIALTARGPTIKGKKRGGTWIMDSPLGHVIRMPSDHPWHGISDLEKRLRTGVD